MARSEELKAEKEKILRRAAGIRPILRKPLPDEAKLPACVVCLNKQRSHALILCKTCSGELMSGAEARRAPFKCPCCRTASTASQKLFF